MDAFVIQGGTRLRGRLRVHGAKNAALPLMAATLLADQPVVLHDVPDLGRHGSGGCGLHRSRRRRGS